MSVTASSVLIARLAQALGAADAERGVSDALALLADLGLSVVAEPAAPAAVEVKRGNGSLRLASTGQPLEPGLAEALSSVLALGVGRAEEQAELRRVSERMEMLSSAAFEGLMVHVDGVVIDGNQRLAELLRCEQRELLGRETMLRCVAPEDLPRVMQYMRDRYEGTYRITGVRHDGSRFRAELQSKQGNLGERPVRVVAVRDVTDREHTFDLLEESEARLRDLVERTYDFVVISRDGIILKLAGDFNRMLGFSAEESIGTRLLDYVAKDWVHVSAGVLAAQRVGAYEVELLSRSGERVPVEIMGVNSTMGGQPVRVSGVRDLRPLRKLERDRLAIQEQLVRSQRLESLAVLAGGVAHDFNNLLVGVLGNAELLQESLEKPDDRELCDTIVLAARRAAELVSQLLVYAGRRDLGPKQPIDLGALWDELTALVDVRLSGRAELVLDIEPGVSVLGDRTTFTQVLMNLLMNASDALGGKPGTIEVRARAVSEPDERWSRALGRSVGPGDWVQLEVQDTGAGMDPATAERIFEPFFSTKTKGHGLGLASCLGIVTAHGGAISVESEPGRGSRFSLLLPAAKLARAE